MLKKLKEMVAAAICIVLALVAGACDIPASDETIVAFEIHTYDSTQIEEQLPVLVTYHMPGYAPWTPEGAQPTPATAYIRSGQFSQVSYDVEAAIQVQGPPGTLVTCSWVATTPSGPRSSERSRGGEGEAVVPEGKTDTTVLCHYLA